MTDLCVRRAWLTLGARSLDLEDLSAGYFCQSLALNFPDVRDVVSTNPDRQGITDRTLFMGGRTVEAQIVAVAGAGATIDAVAASFAPFMDPAARPTLHYVLDRPGRPERIVTGLRAAGYAWPVAGPYQRDIQLQWVASDPIVKDPAQKTATAWSGSSTVAGRTYNLTFNRIYPPGGAGPVTAVIPNVGDVNLYPLFRIYGPITRPQVTVAIPGVGTRFIFFQNTFIIPAGQWVDVDSAARTVYWNSDPNQSAATGLAWSVTLWPVIPAGQTPNATMTLAGSSTSGVTQCQAIWNDGYLT